MPNGLRGQEAAGEGFSSDLLTAPRLLLRSESTPIESSVKQFLLLSCPLEISPHFSLGRAPTSKTGTNFSVQEETSPCVNMLVPEIGWRTVWVAFAALESCPGQRRSAQGHWARDFSGSCQNHASGKAF